MQYDSREWQSDMFSGEQAIEPNLSCRRVL